jgi:signal transduction histidine kinase
MKAISRAPLEERRPDRAGRGRNLVPQVLAAQEAERARVARDLHDQIGQSLTSVLLALRLSDLALDADVPDVGAARSRLEQSRELVTDALRDVRELAFKLRPPALDDLGVAAALERLTERVAAADPSTVTLQLDGLAQARLPADVEVVVYRTVQEALSNAARHARARHVAVVVTLIGSKLHVEVRDDGAGFDPARVPATALGLAGMRERAALVQGRLQIDSASGAGTTVTLEVPL